MFLPSSGFVENRVIGDDVQFREDLTTRIILQADLSDNFSAEFLWQHIDLDRNGKHREVFECVDPAGAMAQGFDCTINASNQSQNIVQGVDVDRQEHVSRRDQHHHQETNR